jgi:hypothetical protein
LHLVLDIFILMTLLYFGLGNIDDFSLQPQDWLLITGPVMIIVMIVLLLLLIFNLDKRQSTERQHR